MNKKTKVRFTTELVAKTCLKSDSIDKQNKRENKAKRASQVITKDHPPQKT